MKTSILLQNYAGCNLHCKVCEPKYTEKNTKVMSTEIFNKIKDRIVEFGKKEKNYQIILGSNGEPTLDPYLQSRILELKSIVDVPIGMHTNGLILRKNKEIIKELDLLIISILGSLHGSRSFTHITGLDFNKHIDLILDVCDNFKKTVVLVITLDKLDNKYELEEMSYRLRGSNVILLISQLLWETPTGLTTKNFNTDVMRDLQVNGVNGLSVTIDSTMQLSKDNYCLMLENDVIITAEGTYGVCCAISFGANPEICSIDQYSIVDWKEKRSSYRNFMSKYQQEKPLSCCSCIIRKTFGWNME